MTMPPAPTADTIRSLRKAGWSTAELKGFLSPWGLDPDVYAPADVGPAVVPPPPPTSGVNPDPGFYQPPPGEPGSFKGDPGFYQTPEAPVASTVDTRVPVAKDASFPPPPNEQAVAMQEAGYSPEAIKAFQAGQGGTATSSVTAAQVQGTGAGKAGLGSIPEPLLPGIVGNVGEEEDFGPARAAPPWTLEELEALSGAETSGPGQLPPAKTKRGFWESLDIGWGSAVPKTGAGEKQPPVPPAGATQPEVAPGQAGGQPGAGVDTSTPAQKYAAGPNDPPWDAKTALNYLIDKGLITAEDALNPDKLIKAIVAGQNRAIIEFAESGKRMWLGHEKTFGALKRASPNDLKMAFGDITGGKAAPSFLEGLWGKAQYDHMAGPGGMTPEQILTSASPEMIAGKVSEMSVMQVKAWLDGYMRANPDITLDQLAKTPGLETTIRAIKATGYGSPVMPKVTPGEVPTIEDWRTGLKTFKNAMTMIPSNLTSAHYWLGLVDSVTPPPGVRFDPVTKSYVMLDGSIIKDPVLAYEVERFKSAMDSYDRMKPVIDQKIEIFIEVEKTQAENEQLKKDLDDADSPDTAAEIAYKMSQADLRLKEPDRKKLIFDATLSLMSNPSALIRASRAGILAGFEDYLGVSIKVPEKMKEGELGMAVQSQLQAIANAPPELAMEMLDDLAMQTGWTAEELLLYIKNYSSAAGTLGGAAFGAQGAVQFRTVRRQ